MSSSKKSNFGQKATDGPTYILGERIGRGQELSDEEFEWFYYGNHDRFTSDRLNEVSSILMSPSWLKEIAAWKLVENQTAPNLSGLNAKLEARKKLSARPSEGIMHQLLGLVGSTLPEISRKFLTIGVEFDQIVLKRGSFRRSQTMTRGSSITTFVGTAKQDRLREFGHGPFIDLSIEEHFEETLYTVRLHGVSDHICVIGLLDLNKLVAVEAGFHNVAQFRMPKQQPVTAISLWQSK